MTRGIGAARGVDLNRASPAELDRIGGLGRDRVQRIVENRPFNSWEELRDVEGFGDTLVEDLRRNGATLGSETEH